MNYENRQSNDKSKHNFNPGEECKAKAVVLMSLFPWLRITMCKRKRTKLKTWKYGLSVMVILTLIALLLNNMNINAGPRTPKHPCIMCVAKLSETNLVSFCDYCELCCHLKYTSNTSGEYDRLGNSDDPLLDNKE